MWSNRQSPWPVILGVALAVIATPLSTGLAAEARPNVLIILADDKYYVKVAQGDQIPEITEERRQNTTF